MRVLLALLAALSVCLAVAQPKPGLPQPVWREYLSGQHSRMDTPYTAVIQTEADFQAYWSRAFGDAPPRDIQWAKELLLVVHLGNRPSAGYRAQIDTVERVRPTEIVVTYAEVTPDGPSASVMTSPWEIVRVERCGGGFSFNKTTRISNIRLNRPAWQTYCYEVTGGGDRAMELAIRDQETFQSYWRSVFSEDAPRDVDWKSEMLIAIHLGNMPTTGFGIAFDQMAATPFGVNVCWTAICPCEGQHVKKQRTSPYLILRVPRFEGSIRFSRSAG